MNKNESIQEKPRICFVLYANQKAPVPKTDIELNEGLNEGLNEELNEGLKSVLKTIQDNEGIQGNKISALLNNRPIKTIERQIKSLVEKGSIERKGSKKTGGYFIKS